MGLLALASCVLLIIAHPESSCHCTCEAHTKNWQCVTTIIESAAGTANGWVGAFKEAPVGKTLTHTVTTKSTIYQYSYPLIASRRNSATTWIPDYADDDTHQDDLSCLLSSTAGSLPSLFTMPFLSSVMLSSLAWTLFATAPALAADVSSAPTVAQQLQQLQQTRRPEVFSKSNQFQLLRRERPITQAMQQVQAVKDLQDSRLDQCVDNGPFWEQCFMYGEKNSKKGGAGGAFDYQLLSPEGALEPAVESRANRQSIPPTW